MFEIYLQKYVPSSIFLLSSRASSSGCGRCARHSQSNYVVSARLVPMNQSKPPTERIYKTSPTPAEKEVALVNVWLSLHLPRLEHVAVNCSLPAQIFISRIDWMLPHGYNSWAILLHFRETVLLLLLPTAACSNHCRTTMILSQIQIPLTSLFGTQQPACMDRTSKTCPDRATTKTPQTLCVPTPLQGHTQHTHRSGTGSTSFTE
jgi:hypothetical protein